MATYLIIYDLHESTSYDELIAAIKEYGTWCHITESVWAVVTESSAKEIRENLDKHLSSDDRLLVVRSGVESAWRNTIGRATWLKKYL